MVLFIDSFLFNGEELVKLRLEYFYAYVDYFYIVESIYTHSLKKKDAYFIDVCASWFTPYMDKIRFVRIDSLFPNNNGTYITQCFYEENNQRKYIRNILLHDFADQDFILALCDMDEIYDLRTLESKTDLFTILQTHIVLFTMKMYYYNFEFLVNDNWENAYLISSTMLKKHEDLNYIRIYKLGDNTLRRISGWHFSYFMKPEEIVRKLASFCHSDVNKPPFNNPNYISFVASHGIDILKRQDIHIKKIPFEDNFHKYPELFRKYKDTI